MGRKESKKVVRSAVWECGRVGKGEDSEGVMSGKEADWTAFPQFSMPGGGGAIMGATRTTTKPQSILGETVCICRAFWGMHKLPEISQTNACRFLSRLSTRAHSVWFLAWDKRMVCGD